MLNLAEEVWHLFRGFNRLRTQPGKFWLNLAHSKICMELRHVNIFSQAKLMQFVHFIFAMARSHHRRAGTHKGEHIVPRHRTWRQSRLPRKETPKATIQNKSWLQINYKKLLPKHLSTEILLGLKQACKTKHPPLVLHRPGSRVKDPEWKRLTNKTDG